MTRIDDRLAEIEARAHEAIWMLPMDAETVPELDQLVMRDVPALTAALRAVLGIHYEEECEYGYCPTIRAIAAALSVTP